MNHSPFKSDFNGKKSKEDESEEILERKIEETEQKENDLNNTQKAKEIYEELSKKSEEKKKERKKREFKDIIGLEQFVEGILYILARPVSLKELMLFTQTNQEKIIELIETITSRYETDNTAYKIYISESEDPDLKMYELRLTEKAFGILSNVDFVTTEELPAKYYKFMSTLTFLELVENKKITIDLLKKNFGLEQSVIEKNIRVLIQYGFLDSEKDKETYYTTSPRFLRKMGLPTDTILVKKVLKDKAIAFAMKQSGFDEI